MNNIRLIPDDQLDEFVRIHADAYPGVTTNSEEDIKRVTEHLLEQNKDPRCAMWGCYSGETLIGGVRLHDYIMTLHGVQFLCGGGGNLAVGLLNKKEHIAKEMMLFFFRKYRDQGAPMAALWPFRPDFYRQMGAGYGNQIHEYRIKPQHLPHTGNRHNCRNLDKSDSVTITDCYNRIASVTNGMMQDTLIRREINMKQSKGARYVGYETDGTLQGFITFSFKKTEAESFIDNDLVVRELFYENKDALSALMAFLHTQADQINRIVIRTHEEDFHHLPFDPRDSSRRLIPPVYHQTGVTGVGIMYRVLDVKALFEKVADHNFNGQTVTVRLGVSDSFLPENGGVVTVQVTNGRLQLVTDDVNPDVEVGMDIADFSSLIIGAVRFRSLYTYSRASISDASLVATIDKLFATDHTPACTTDF